jgi:predicted MFS family arabinose efflux permease
LQITLGTEKIGLSSNDATWGVSVIGILSTAGRLSGGILSKTLKKHRAKLGAAGMALTAVGLMLIPATDTFPSFLVVCACIGYVCICHPSLSSQARRYGSGLYVATGPVLIGEIATQVDFPKAYGLIYASQMPSALLGVPVAGLVVSASSYQSAFLMGGGAIAVASALILSLNFVKPYEPCVFLTRFLTLL